MKVLVTGHKGFIGSNVMKLIPDAIGYDYREVSEDNILNEQHFQEVLKKHAIEAVIHLAAQVSVEDSLKNPLLYVEHNVLGTQKVLTSCIKAGVKKIVYASSSACSEPSSTTYAMTKYVPELMLDIAKNDIQTVALRFFNVYGQGSNPAYARAIDAFIDGLQQNGKVIIYGDGEQSRDFIHVVDIARGIKAALDNDVPSGEVIDLGTGTPYSINFLAKKIAQIMGKELVIDYQPARKEVRHSHANPAKAFQLLHFTPQISLQKGLEGLING